MAISRPLATKRRPLGGRMAGVCLWAALAISGCVASGAGQQQPSLEYQVKAAFLLNFTKFVEWPAAPAEAPFSLCVAGEDPFGPSLDRLVEGENVNGRKLVVRRVRRGQTAGCQLVFFPASERDLGRVLPSLGPGVLTVGESERFLREGGMIGFVIDNRRVRFDVKPSTAAAAGLRISSKLLSVARNVER